MGFSRRTGWDRGEGGLARAVREAGPGLVDLTVSNPTVCGFSYGPEVLGALQDGRALTYGADARGMRVAREAVAGYYEGRVDADAVVLTTSTSEAYSFLFRLLCDAGDEVLVASPSYPLFDFLADLDDVRLVSYPLFQDFGWWIDFAELERRVTVRTRAVLLVHPNNPTGHVTSEAERERLEEFCAGRGLALIVDEVFLDYGLAGRVRSFTEGSHGCLKFVVSGLSKVAALPQMKVGWLVALGPGREEALGRLEIVADTFLSVNAPSQLALERWLGGREAVQGQILGRVRENLEELRLLDGLEMLAVEAGWSVVLRARREVSAEVLVREAGVVVHPGEFYGLGSRYLVVSGILPVAVMRAGVEKLNGWMNLFDY